MKKYNVLIAVAVLLVSVSCKKETKEALIDYPEDITFNEIELDRFSFKFPDGKMSSGNDKSGRVSFSGERLANGDFEGFVVSNKNYRSYPWSLSYTFGDPDLAGAALQEAIDSTVFSVFTARPNRTENYLVGNAASGKTILELDRPAVIEHVLIANTTYSYLHTAYGSVYSDELDPESQKYKVDGGKVRNPLNPNTSTEMYGVFYLPTIDGSEAIRLSGFLELEKKKAGDIAKQEALNAGLSAEEAEEAYNEAYEGVKKGYLKLIVEGYNGGNKVGEVEHYLAVRKGVHPEYPDYDFIQNEWEPLSLTALGEVSELKFKMDGDYRSASGELLSSSHFCIDGIRLLKK